MTDETLPQRLRATVERWLVEDHWTVEERPAGPSVTWALQATDRLGKPVIFYQLDEAQDKVVLETYIEVGPEASSRIEAMEPERREQLVHDLRMELGRARLDFEGAGLPLQRITVGQSCYFDGLTKDAFLQRVRNLQFGIGLVIELFRMQLR